MKGMLDFLEKAGLVKKDAPQATPATDIDTPLTHAATPLADAGTAPGAATPAAGTGAPLDLEHIYATQGVGPSLYPAERLLRLVDGLSAMDEATRHMAITAMDAADESWTIDDPLADAAAKIKALTAHSESIAANLQQLEQETQAHLDTVAQRQEKVVSDIRQQIAELEGLVTRELNRSAQETASLEAQRKAARDQIARDLAEVAQVQQRLQGLASQFGAVKTSSGE